MNALITTVLELLGMLVAVTGLAVFWATVAPAAWAWPVGLLVWGLGTIAVSWFLQNLQKLPMEGDEE